jgi:hypothetical protein
MKVELLDNDWTVQVSDIDVKNMTVGEGKVIGKLFLSNLVVVIKDQQMTAEENLEFCKHFGKIDSYSRSKLRERLAESVAVADGVARVTGALDDKGKPVAFISHKAGSTAKHYQQYGGLSDKALPTKYRNNKDIKQFMQDVAKERPDGLKSGDSFYRPIRDKNLIAMMMYGPEYGKGPTISNVDEFHLGNMILKGKGEGPYTITSNHKGTNGEIPKGQFEAVLFIRFQARRGDARSAGETVKNARVGVFPIAKISSTTKKI